jgi:DNA-binding response OmpR family regulator
MGSRILVAEDDPKQAELIRLYLERDGHSVMVVHDGRTALERIRAVRPDLVVLDLMMPRMDGLDVARVVRTEATGLPIVMVTARSTEDDVLLGLDLGADDYITKPFSPRELAARVRAVLRRSGRAAEEPILKVGGLEVDRVRHEVRMRGDHVECTPKEFSILEAMAEEPGRAFTRHQLLERAFGFDYYALERTADVHLMKLRKKIERDPSNPEYLHTVYGVGYKLEAPDA